MLQINFGAIRSKLNLLLVHAPGTSAISVIMSDIGILLPKVPLYSDS